MAVEIGRALAAVTCVVVVACAFSGAGKGEGLGGLGDEDDDGGGSDTDPGSADDDEGPGTDEGGVEDAAGDDADPGGPADDTGGDGPPVIGGAEIVFVEGSTIDLGEIDPNNAVPLPPIVIRNDGDVDAEAVSGGSLVPPLAWAGGAFPGTGGTCGGTLAPGQTCGLVLSPAPAPIGLTSQMLTIDYEDSGFAETVVAVVEAVGRGTSEELVRNGSFKEGGAGSPPAQWTVASGGWQTTINSGWDDNRSAFAGSATVGSTVSLAQEIDLAQWADTIAAVGLGLRIEGAGRAQNNDIDQWLTVVTELDAGGSPQAMHASTPSGYGDWAGFLHELALAPGTRRVRIELQCVMNNGSNCNVWFDGVQAHATYPPP